jgi:hypothetical protein
MSLLGLVVSHTAKNTSTVVVQMVIELQHTAADRRIGIVEPRGCMIHPHAWTLRVRASQHALPRMPSENTAPAITAFSKARSAQRSRCSTYSMRR